MSDPETSAPKTSVPAKPGFGIFVRSLVFNIVFVLNNILWFVLALPALMLPRKTFFLNILHPWCWSNLKLHALICGVRMEFRGRENIPSGGLIVAAKHQSAWETLALAASFPEPRYILKRELMWVPLFGLYLKRTGQVAINRGKRADAIAAMNRAAELAVREGGQLLVFPEGTRRPIGAEPAYKQGVAHLYEAIGAVVVPWRSTPASSGRAAPSSSSPARSSWSSCRRSRRDSPARSSSSACATRSRRRRTASWPKGWPSGSGCCASEPLLPLREKVALASARVG